MEDVQLLQANCYTFAHANGGCALHTDCKRETMRKGKTQTNAKEFGFGGCHYLDFAKVVEAISRNIR